MVPLNTPSTIVALGLNVVPIACPPNDPILLKSITKLEIVPEPFDRLVASRLMPNLPVLLDSGMIPHWWILRPVIWPALLLNTRITSTVGPRFGLTIIFAVEDDQPVHWKITACDIRRPIPSLPIRQLVGTMRVLPAGTSARAVLKAVVSSAIPLHTAPNLVTKYAPSTVEGGRAPRRGPCAFC